MSRSKRTPSIARLFDRCPDPIYLIDDRRRVAYANDALLEWTGLARDELIGRAVEYHAHEAPVTMVKVAEGLCPPPTAMAGETADGFVWCVRADGSVANRRGRFLPLRSEGKRGGTGASPTETSGAAAELGNRPVLVLLEGSDRSASELDHTTGVESRFQELHVAVARLRQQRSVRRAGVALVGESDAMLRARRQIELAAATRSAVLVVGSDPWQRRRVAEVLPYVRNGAHTEAVIPFDSVLMDENLLSWSLDSLADRGRDPATLLFHDVHELPTAAQAFLADRLARWPEQWRVIATCASMSDENAMLETLDVRLFQWLSTLVVDLPPLRARMEDLPLVVQYLVEELNAEGSRQVAGFSQAALDRMHLFDWPGGLAQLREAIAAAHAATTSPEVPVRDLPSFLARAETAAAFPGETVEPIALESVLAEIEVKLIRRALDLADGNKTQAAALLGMTRPRLYRRLEQLGLDR